MKIKLLNYLKASVLLIFIFSCSKFEEGGKINKANQNLTANKWVISNFEINDIDETNKLSISNYTEEYKENGTLIRTFTDNDNEEEIQTGKWEFIDNNLKIKIDGVGSIEYTNQSGTLSSSEIEILKLEKGIFWYRFQNGSDKNVFKMISQ